MEQEPEWIVKKAVDALGYDKIAEHLGKTARTVRRWHAGEVKASKSDLMVLEQLYLHLYKSPPKKKRFHLH